jgi:Uri superfamily endonuclease
MIEESRTCIKCQATKPDISFKSANTCKACVAVYEKQYHKANYTKIKARQQAWAENNRERYREILRKHRDLNRDAIRLSDRERLQNDIAHRLKRNIRARLSCAISRKIKQTSAIDGLGCSIEELKAHLESKFQLGMTWDNYGKWHIDHIKPLSSFDLTKLEEQLVACHYSNLQPLWAQDNLIKSNKFSSQ